MSAINVGNQKISWKYQTPLEAETLSMALSGYSGTGLCTRPKFNYSASNGNVNSTLLQIKPFSLIIEPYDEIDNELLDEYGNRIVRNVSKVTTTSDAVIEIHRDTVAVGFEYSFRDNGIAKKEWYGNFVALNKTEVEIFKGIIIATVCSRVWTNPESSIDVRTYFSVSTQGADISDALLISEGFNPNCWLSLTSPRRGSSKYNTVEVRTHNGILNGLVHSTSSEMTYKPGNASTISPVELGSIEMVNSGVSSNLHSSVMNFTEGDGVGSYFNGFQFQTTQYGNAKLDGRQLKVYSEANSYADPSKWYSMAILDDSCSGFACIKYPYYDVEDIEDYNSNNFTNKIKIYPVVGESFVGGRTLYGSSHIIAKTITDNELKNLTVHSDFLGDMGYLGYSEYSFANDFSNVNTLLDSSSGKCFVIANGKTVKLTGTSTYYPKRVMGLGSNAVIDTNKLSIRQPTTRDYCEFVNLNFILNYTLSKSSSSTTVISYLRHLKFKDCNFNITLKYNTTLNDKAECLFSDCEFENCKFTISFLEGSPSYGIQGIFNSCNNIKNCNLTITKPYSTTFIIFKECSNITNCNVLMGFKVGDTSVNSGFSIFNKCNHVIRNEINFESDTGSFFNEGYTFDNCSDVRDNYYVGNIRYSNDLNFYEKEIISAMDEIPIIFRYEEFGNRYKYLNPIFMGTTVDNGVLIENNQSVSFQFNLANRSLDMLPKSCSGFSDNLSWSDDCEVYADGSAVFLDRSGTGGQARYYIDVLNSALSGNAITFTLRNNNNGSFNYYGGKYCHVRYKLTCTYKVPAASSNNYQNKTITKNATHSFVYEVKRNS